MKVKISQTENKMNLRSAKDRQSVDDNLDSVLRDIRKKDMDGRTNAIAQKKLQDEEMVLLKQMISSIGARCQKNFSCNDCALQNLNKEQVTQH